MQAYLDNGNTTPVLKEVVGAMLPYFSEKYGHPLFIYSLGREANEAVEEASELIANTIGASADELTFTSGATDANDLAVRGVAYANKDRGKHLIVSKIENPSVLRVTEELEKQGFRVDYLDVDKEGFVDLEKLESLIDEETTLVSIMHVSDEIGTIEPLEEIGALLNEQKHKIYFHTDAAASYARAPIDVGGANVDLLSISSHKIHGPKGVGILYIRKGTKIEPVNYGYLSLSKLRPGTENVPGIVGFAKAAELAFENFDADVKHMRRLRDKLMSGIEDGIEHVVLHGPRGDKRSPANVNYSFKYVEGESVMMQLDFRGISVATGSACATRKLEPSHVLTAIGVDPVVAHGAIRFTLSKLNTEEEIDYTLEALPEVIENLRKISPMKPGES
jgi:cysteine desulfurase